MSSCFFHIHTQLIPSIDSMNPMIRSHGKEREGMRTVKIANKQHQKQTWGWWKFFWRSNYFSFHLSTAVLQNFYYFIVERKREFEMKSFASTLNNFRDEAEFNDWLYRVIFNWIGGFIRDLLRATWRALERNER